MGPNKAKEGLPVTSTLTTSKTKGEIQHHKPSAQEPNLGKLKLEKYEQNKQTQKKQHHENPSQMLNSSTKRT